MSKLLRHQATIVGKRLEMNEKIQFSMKYFPRFCSGIILAGFMTSFAVKNPPILRENVSLTIATKFV